MKLGTREDIRRSAHVRRLRELIHESSSVDRSRRLSEAALDAGREQASVPRDMDISRIRQDVDAWMQAVVTDAACVDDLLRVSAFRDHFASEAFEHALIAYYVLASEGRARKCWLVGEASHRVYTSSTCAILARDLRAPFAAERERQEALKQAEAIRRRNEARARIAELERIAAERERVERKEAAIRAAEKARWKDRVDEIARAVSERIAYRSPDVASLEPDDYALCARWANLDPRGVRTLGDLASRLPPHEAARLATARMGERAALRWYGSFGRDVTDISVTQLLPAARDWMAYDLLAAGRPVDVKSARRSLSSSNSYSEYCVAGFKRDKRGEDVTLFAVLLDYLSLPRMLDEGQLPRAVILGEVDLRTLRAAYAVAARLTSKRLRLDGLGRTDAHLPGWVFSYPLWCAPEKSLERVTCLVGSALADGLAPGQLSEPLLQMVGEATRGSQDARDRLRLVESAVGRGRFAACVFALVEFVRAALGDVTADPLVVRAMVGAEGEPPWYFDLDLDLPLGVTSNVVIREPQVLLASDQEQFAATLVDALSTLWNFGGREAFGEYTTFRLLGGGILQGVHQDGRSRTLLAYCGGWADKGKCGRSPLVLGVHTSCAACGRLLCDVCGHCSEPCASERKKVSHPESIGAPDPLD